MTRTKQYISKIPLCETNTSDNHCIRLSLIVSTAAMCCALHNSTAKWIFLLKVQRWLGTTVLSDSPGWIKPMAKTERTSAYLSHHQQPFEFEGFLPEPEKNSWTWHSCARDTQTQYLIFTIYQIKPESFNVLIGNDACQFPRHNAACWTPRVLKCQMIWHPDGLRLMGLGQSCSIIVKQPAHRGPICTWQFWLC